MAIQLVKRFLRTHTSSTSLWKEHIKILYTFPCQKSANKNKKIKRNKKKEQKNEKKMKIDFPCLFSCFFYVFFLWKISITQKIGKQKLNKQNQPLYKPPCPCFFQIIIKK